MKLELCPGASRHPLIWSQCGELAPACQPSAVAGVHPAPWPLGALLGSARLRPPGPGHRGHCSGQRVAQYRWGENLGFPAPEGRASISSTQSGAVTSVPLREGGLPLPASAMLSLPPPERPVPCGQPGCPSETQMWFPA